MSLITRNTSVGTAEGERGLERNLTAPQIHHHLSSWLWDLLVMSSPSVQAVRPPEKVYCKHKDLTINMDCKPTLGILEQQR
jgi:hypothetical protein